MSEAAVYRMFDASGVLLYVGMSASVSDRIRAHRGRDWWPDVVRIDIEHFAGRKAAAFAEARAIESESPLHNIRAGVMVADDTLEERRAKREAERQRAEARRHWDPEGAVRCDDCGFVPTRLRRGARLAVQQCDRCGVAALVNEGVAA